MAFDLIVITDPRFPGGTSIAVAAEIEAASGLGYRVALLPLEAPNLRGAAGFHPKIRTLIESNRCTLVSPGLRVEANLVQIHSPHVARGFPFRPLKVRAEARMLVMHHPPFDGNGLGYFDLPAVCLHAEEMLGGPVRLAPVGPAVRSQLAADPRTAGLLTRADWTNVVDVDRWRLPRTLRTAGPMAIGRHSRPDLRKWPGGRREILLAYPDADDVAVHVLGAFPQLESLLGGYPANWTVHPFNGIDNRAFLAGLDIYVYQHHPNWVESFGYGAAEALASGLPCVLPAVMAPTFGEVARCVPLEATMDTVRSLWLAPEARNRAASDGRDFVAGRFGRDAYAARLADEIGPPAHTVVPANRTGARRSPDRVLLLSSNGVGMGHLTRMLAIARRLPADVEPVFVTMSQAAAIVEERFGYIFEYLPYHRNSGINIQHWNAMLRRELAELVDFYDARAVVFDANSPFEGLVAAIADRPSTWWIWCRRGMWRRGAGSGFIQRESAFDMVLEPADLADAFDEGLTVGRRPFARRTGPIRLLDDHELLPRDLARRQLGLAPEATAILIMLANGQGTTFDLMRRVARDQLRRGGAEVVEALWHINVSAAETEDDGVRVLRDYPFARHFHAFDGVVSAVGYNSFHEIIQARLPAVFVSNEAPQMDNQEIRGQFAERRGAALSVRAGDVYGLGRALAGFLDPDVRGAMSERAGALSTPNGAADAARLVVEFARTRRTAASLLDQRAGWCDVFG